jgi:predicted ATPase
MAGEMDGTGLEWYVEELLKLLGAADAGHGSVVFLSGEPGMGRRAVVDGLRERSAEAAVRQIRLCSAVCRSDDRTLNAFYPFAELLAELAVEPAERGRSGPKAVLSALTESAPSWLNLVPVVGAGLSATWEAARERLAETAGATDMGERPVRVLARQFERVLDAVLQGDATVVLTLARAQWIDLASLQMLEELSSFIAEHRVLCLVSYRGSALSASSIDGPSADTGTMPEHPLRTTRDRLVMDINAKEIRLAPLDLQAVGRRVAARTGAVPTNEVAAYLMRLGGGNPLLLDGLVEALCDPAAAVLAPERGQLSFGPAAPTDEDTIDLAVLQGPWRLPRKVEVALEQRLQSLPPEDREVLQLGAVHGDRFSTATVASAARVDHDDVLRRLARLERGELVAYLPAGSTGTDFLYEFTHLLLRRSLYESLEGPLRARSHQEIAAAIEAHYGEVAPLSALLDIARHKQLGRLPLDAARYYHRAARTAALEGAQWEARGLAERALSLLGQLTAAPAARVNEREVASLRAGAALTYLTTLDPRWTGTSPPARDQFRRVLVEGQAAAELAGDGALLGRLRHLEANAELSSGSWSRTRELFEEALDLTARAGDDLARLGVLIDLANVLDIDDLAAGKEMLSEARALCRRLVGATSGPLSTELRRLEGRIDAMQGIAECDSGEIGAALRLLDGALSTLRSSEFSADLPRVTNYWAQAALLAGDREGAAGLHHGGGCSAR